ncbi:hypothetical protein D3C84_702250 [compost metagenome]
MPTCSLMSACLSRPVRLSRDRAMLSRRARWARENTVVTRALSAMGLLTKSSPALIRAFICRVMSVSADR